MPEVKARARGEYLDGDEAVLRRFAEFDAANGGSENAVEYDRQYIFPTGATRSVVIAYGTPLFPPPDDPLKLAWLKRKCAEVRLSHARTDFVDYKRQLAARAAHAIEHVKANVPPAPPGPAEVAKLAELQQAVIQRQADYEAADKAIEDARPQWQKERDKHAEEALPAMLETQRIINEMKI
jgi:hypothetical protein